MFIAAIETQTSAENIEQNVLKMTDCKKLMKDASVCSNVDYLPEGLSMGSIENDDDDEDEDCGKKKSFSSFSSLFFNCGSYDLRYSRENTFSASINAVGILKLFNQVE